MDRTEFKERIDRIDFLISENNTEEALDLLDSINWKKVLNVNYLLEGADRYERLGKYNDSKEMLIDAHGRSPMGRMIICRLSLCCAHMGEIEEARNYYQKFIELAPNDNIRFIIKYEIEKSNGSDDFVLISILEELRANELLEDWAFELACLYRKTGQIEKCITLLDDIILWFGEGPYVEKSLEMKLLYRPLTKDQEIRYQRMTTEGRPVLEIHPGDVGHNEYLGQTIRIPKIEETNERFNTQNLQAEIRKNIEEIMKASEVGEVSENIDAIKDLIEDIPHLQMEEAKAESIEEKKFNTQKMDESLKSKFQEYLSEEFDGQLSLTETGKEAKEEQIDGQMTIDDIVKRWEKTKRAAEQTLLEAKQQELIKYKEEALARASDVLDKLLESESSLTPTEKPDDKEPNQKDETVEQASKADTKEEKEDLKLQKTFKIPVIDAEGLESEDFEIPIIKIDDIIEGEKSENKDESDTKDKEAIETKENTEEPKDSDELENTEEAKEDAETVKLSAEETLKGINEMLQSEIDKLSGKEGEKEEPDDSEEERIDNSISFEEKSLTQSQKARLSYFASIPGMEEALCKVIDGVKGSFQIAGPKATGHIIVQGREGSGKTRLAQNIIGIIQEETDNIKGNIGRITAEKLNEKDIRTLFDKIRGGALIIENAGQLGRDTLVSLSLNIEGDTSRIQVVLEDTRDEIEKLLNSDPRFAKKFTEKVSIPVMTIDELVNFGKIYAAENGYGIDEMGILALYDKINMVEKPDYPATVKDVKTIIDSAIDSAQNAKFKGLFGLFGNKGGEDANAQMLQERDF